MNLHSNRTCLEALDEAFHRLRQTSAGTWLIYAVPAVPLLLCVLTELQDLRLRRPYLIDGKALTLLAVLYLCFGIGRSEFARRLKFDILQEAASRTNWRAIANHLVLETAELALMPLGVLSVVGFPWLLAFFRFALGQREVHLRTLIPMAAQRASAAYRRSWVLTFILIPVAFATFLNLLLSAVAFPELFKMFSGLETIFTRNRSALLNWTTVGAAVGLTLLLCEALLLAYFNLEIFYGESQANGRDLLLELETLKKEAA